MSVSGILPKTELPKFSIHQAELSSDNTDIVSWEGKEGDLYLKIFFVQNNYLFRISWWKGMFYDKVGVCV